MIPFIGIWHCMVMTRHIIHETYRLLKKSSRNKYWLSWCNMYSRYSCKCFYKNMTSQWHHSSLQPSMPSGAYNRYASVNLVIIESENWIIVACSAPCDYLNQLSNDPLRSFETLTKTSFILNKMNFKMSICKITVILSLHQYVKVTERISMV